MKRSLTVDLLKPGMLLLKQISGPTESEVIKANTILNNEHLKLMQTWETPSIEVDDAVNHAPELVLKFKHSDLNHPFVYALYEYCKEETRSN